MKLNSINLNTLIAHDGILYFGRECVDKALLLLSDPETRMVDGAPTQEFVNQLLPTLEARLGNTANTVKRIFGLEKTIERLKNMSGAACVIGYGFISPRAAGNIYLDKENTTLLGITVVDR